MPSITPKVETSLIWSAVILGEGTSDSDYNLEGIMTSTKKLEVSSSIQHLYLYGEWVFSGGANLIEDGHLAIGKKILFKIVPESSSTLVYDLILSIISISNGPGSSTTYLGETYTLTLISPWYFDQKVKSKAYKGNTTTIVKKIIQEELVGSFDSYLLAESTDPSSVTRYRTLMTPGRFIEERLKTHYVGFTYINIKNEFEMMNMTAMSQLDPYVFIDPSNPNLANFSNWLNDEQKSLRMVYMNGMIFKMNTTKEKELWSILSPSYYYMSHLKGDVIKTIPTAPTEYGLIPLSGTIKKGFTVVKPSNTVSESSKTFTDDSFRNYNDGAIMRQNKYFNDLMDCHQVIVTAFPNVNLQVGRLAYLFISGITETNPSVLSSTYVITEVSHVFQANRVIMHVTLKSSAIQYEDENRIMKFFHVNNT